MKNKLFVLLSFLLCHSGITIYGQTDCPNELINYNDGVNFLSIANAINPNGDAPNDNIPFIFNNVVELLFNIYDSESNLVHSGNANSSYFWDGANAAPGQYTMFLNVEFQNGTTLTDICRTLHILAFDEAENCFPFDTVATPLLFADQFDPSLFILDPSIPSNEIICSELVGIEKLLSDQINIGPNPSSDFIYINSDKNIESIKIIDTSGNLVLNTFQSTKLDISRMPAGLYFMSIQVDGQTITKKFIVE